MVTGLPRSTELTDLCAISRANKLEDQARKAEASQWQRLETSPAGRDILEIPAWEFDECKNWSPATALGRRGGHCSQASPAKPGDEAPRAERLRKADVQQIFGATNAEVTDATRPSNGSCILLITAMRQDIRMFHQR